MSNAVFGSFRDPNGFLFCRKDLIYRQVNFCYKENYDYLMSSGLYKALVDARLLISHKELDPKEVDIDKAYKILQPEIIPFISYPYEWCFSQLKHAALLTLKIQKIALDFGMSLKDSSAYNIQFRDGKPILIDTLSFQKYRKGQVWPAYRQFCQHFLAPLALMSYSDIRLQQLLRIYIDGVPLDLASSLLPFRSKFTLNLLSHIHLHAKSQKHFEAKAVNINKYEISLTSLKNLINDLISSVRKINWIPKDTEWVRYYKDCDYLIDALTHKKQLVGEFLDIIKPKVVWDIGANTGIFSRIASNKGAQTISFDIDVSSVEKNYLECIKNDEENILPLLLDLNNPSPAIGWKNQERMSLLDRGPTDAILALALIHHLCISNNVPISEIADFFSKICNSLIIEFIPKNDPKVQKLLSTREDIFPNYTQSSFEAEFKKFFTIQRSVKIKNSQRTLYLMEKTLP